MKVAAMIPAEFGLTWTRWKRLVDATERLGFSGLFRSDHFTWDSPPDQDSLELVTSLTYLADHSQHLHFGPLVAPLSLRNPMMFARQAMALDDLSNGRMILGVGAGWNQREHTMFGYQLGNVKERIDRLGEGLEVITRLIRSAEPVTFEGRYYQLREAHLLPRPQRSTPVMVGGNGPKRVLPLVARYADIWNYQGSVEEFQERSALLDDLLRAEGRQPGDVTRTVMLPVICWRDESDRERQIALLRSSIPQLGSMSTEAVLDIFRPDPRFVLGTPEQVIARLNAFMKAGVAEVMIWTGQDIDGLEIIAEHVLPYVIPQGNTQTERA